MKKGEVFQLKVTLKGINPPIWRRILIPSNATFWELHIAIQDSFGWEDYHLHELYIGSAWERNVPRICLPHLDDIDFRLPNEKDPLDESKTTLSSFLSEQQNSITYVYDMGDGWEHGVLLENVLPFDPQQAYPQVIDGKRLCPWEDSGGPGGYQEKIEILKDKNNEYHEEIKEWIGINSIDELDLEYFDPEEIVFRNPATELQKYQKWNNEQNN